MRDGDLKGLVDGVVLEVLGSKEDPPLDMAAVLAGENLEGTVPALDLLGVFCELLSDGGMKSGNPSWLGDSGMVSRSGVEPPLAGGPHIVGVRPSWACISRALCMYQMINGVL